MINNIADMKSLVFELFQKRYAWFNLSKIKKKKKKIVFFDYGINKKFKTKYKLYYHTLGCL